MHHTYACYRGTAFWCPCAQIILNLENQDLDRRNLHSMLKISYAACLCPSLLILVPFALEMCPATQNRRKIRKKLLLWCSRSSKVTALSANQKPMYDFLLVINNNLGLAPFLRYSNLLAKNCKFTLPHSYLVPLLSVIPFTFTEKLHGSWN